MATDNAPEQIVHFSYNLTYAVDYLNWFHRMGPKISAEASEKYAETFAIVVAQHVQHIDGLQARVSSLSIYFGAGYLELAKGARGVTPPQLWSPSDLVEYSYPSHHLFAYRWLVDHARNLAKLLGYRLNFDHTIARQTFESIDRNELLPRWIERGVAAADWAQEAAAVPPDGYGLLAMERLQAMMVCEAVAKVLPKIPLTEDDDSAPSPAREGKRGAFQRDHLWLKWYESDGETTHRSPASIRDKWDSMPDTERRQASPGWPSKTAGGSKGLETVEKAIKKARDERDASENQK